VTDAIFSGISPGDEDHVDDGRRGRRGRRGSLSGGIQTAAQIAAAEEESYQKGFDAGMIYHT